MALETRTRTSSSEAGARGSRIRHNVRILHVLAAMDFKLKYAGSALGYVWSVVKPLALFTMMYLVFGRIFDLRSISQYYPLSLLIGIVLFTFFAEATNLGMGSVVERAALLRKLSFPRLVIPTSRTVGVGITLAVNLTVIAAFVAWNRITPRWDWILLVPLLAELFLFTLGVALILAAIFVRLRDIGQIWELFSQLLFYATPIIYPIGFLPPWARSAAFLNPFTQVLQDVRALVLYADLPDNKITAAEVFAGYGGRAIPIAIALGVFLLGVYVFRREAPSFAERV